MIAFPPKKLKYPLVIHPTCHLWLNTCVTSEIRIYATSNRLTTLSYRKELTNFDSLIMSLFLYAIEVWGCAFQDKYISRFDKFCKHSLRFGYMSKQISFKNIIADRDRSLWNKLNNDPDHCLKDLLPERRRCRSLCNRRHNYILPQVRTERFKRCFINRCLFKF